MPLATSQARSPRGQRTPLGRIVPPRSSAEPRRARDADAELEAKALKADRRAVIGFGGRRAGLPDAPTTSSRPRSTHAGATPATTAAAGGLPELRGDRSPTSRWVEPEQVVAGGNSSLVMMREVLTDLWLKGAVDGERPWGQEEKVRFVCPVPGYDRHVTQLDRLGIELVTVPMTDDGPARSPSSSSRRPAPSDQGAAVRLAVANPTGAVYTPTRSGRSARVDDDRGAGLQDPLGHHRRDLPPAPRYDAKSADTGSLPGAGPRTGRCMVVNGVAKTYAMTGWRVGWLIGPRPSSGLGQPRHGAIGPAKVNQLRHSQFFGSPQGVRDHMRQAPRDHRAEQDDRDRCSTRSTASTSRPGPSRPAPTSSASTSWTARRPG